jgi:catechol 2,3-dioxygenase-like lactoylglutathione lyase family enzyme
MKVNSISGITCYVKDVSETASFYEAIGFRRGKEEPDRITFYWVPPPESLMAVDNYRGLVEVDETRSSLLTIRNGRVVRVQGFADPDGARQAPGLPP